MNDKRARSAQILIVDGELILAMDFKLVLRETNFDSVGMTGNLAKALSIIDSGICDAAVLDASLAGVSAAPIAAALAARGLPFLVLSGYAPEQQPGALRAGRYLQKTADPA